MVRVWCGFSHVCLVNKFLVFGGIFRARDSSTLEMLKITFLLVCLNLYYDN